MEPHYQHCYLIYLFTLAQLTGVCALTHLMFCLFDFVLCFMLFNLSFIYLLLMNWSLKGQMYQQCNFISQCFLYSKNIANICYPMFLIDFKEICLNVAVIG